MSTDPGHGQSPHAPFETTEESAGFGFGSDARIKRRADYRRAYDEGRRSSGRYFLVFVRRREGSERSEIDRFSPSRLGVTTTRRCGKAVVRNRLKRVVREFFRLRRAEMTPGLDVVVNARSTAAEAGTRILWRDLQTVFRKAGVLGRTTEQKR